MKRLIIIIAVFLIVFLFCSRARAYFAEQVDTPQGIASALSSLESRIQQLEWNQNQKIEDLEKKLDRTIKRVSTIEEKLDIRSPMFD